MSRDNIIHHMAVDIGEPPCDVVVVKSKFITYSYRFHFFPLRLCVRFSVPHAKFGRTGPGVFFAEPLMTK